MPDPPNQFNTLIAAVDKNNLHWYPSAPLSLSPCIVDHIQHIKQLLCAGKKFGHEKCLCSHTVFIFYKLEYYMSQLTAVAFLADAPSSHCIKACRHWLFQFYLHHSILKQVRTSGRRSLLKRFVFYMTVFV